jgi:hypothetical protein
MTKKACTLNIETPCHQNWNAMDSSSEGKYCHQCSRNVIDLTKLSDTEILAIIKRSNDGLCGRITKKQSGRVLTHANAKYDLPVMRKMIAGILLFSGAGSGVYGQTNPVANVQVRVKDTEEKKTDPAAPPSDTVRNLFQGIVTDEETQEPLISATIMITGTGVGTTTDVDGKFVLKIPNDQLKDSIHVSIHYITYEAKSFAVSKHKFISEQALTISSPFMIPLKQSEVTMLGVIVTKKTKWWKRKHR